MSTTALTAVIPPALLNRSGTVRVFVENGDIMGIADGYHGYPKSNAVDFDVTPGPAGAGIYTAILSASAICAIALRADVRSRTYSASLGAGGDIRWNAPTIQEAGHSQVSRWTLSGQSFSFVIGTVEDSQSDAFHGIWEELGGGASLAVSGTGTGTLRDGDISGTFEGLFEVSAQGARASFCQARNHRFTLELK